MALGTVSRYIFGFGSSHLQTFGVLSTAHAIVAVTVNKAMVLVYSHQGANASGMSSKKQRLKSMHATTSKLAGVHHPSISHAFLHS